MTITIKEDSNRLIALLSGELDSMACKEAAIDLEPLKKQTDKDVEFDCRELTYIASSGLRLLLNVYSHQRTNKKRTILSHLRKEVSDIFKISGFLKLFEVAE